MVREIHTVVMDQVSQRKMRWLLEGNIKRTFAASAPKKAHSTEVKAPSNPKRKHN